MPASSQSNFLYGAAVRTPALITDHPYQELVARYCDLVVPEGELKWASVQAKRGVFNFDKADAVVDFAKRHGIGVRGHTLAWYAALPAWTKDMASRQEAERVLEQHIRTVVGRYAGTIRSWDVVNEPFPDDPRSSHDLRKSVWLEQIGREYIPLAFRIAHETDPAARLFINEYDIAFAGSRFKSKRDALLGLVRELVNNKVPIHGVGIQAHINADRQIDSVGLQEFLHAISSLGLEVIVTELDVIDFSLPADIQLRDALVAAKAYEFLDVVCGVAAPPAVLTWGITDKYTWVPIYFTRADKLPNRPLPFDRNMRPKPLYSVIEYFRYRGRR